MITLFNSKTLYIGYDMARFNEIRDYLERNHIKHKSKVKNRMGQWSGEGTLRGRTGSLGTPAELTYEYEILVKKEDYHRISSEYK